MPYFPPPTPFSRLYHANRKEKRAGSPCPSSMIFNLFFYPGDQFAGTNIKSQCDFPQRFKICLFRPIFDHCQVGACNSRKAAQHILGNSLFFAEVSNSLSNSKVIELHTITSFFFIQTTSSQFELTSLSINRNEEAKNETYTAYISPEILDEGEYGLVYERGSGRQNQNLTYMRRADGYLTFTREIDHFAPPGANGTFYISHNYFALSETDDIVCSVTRSTGYKYQF